MCSSHLELDWQRIKVSSALVGLLGAGEVALEPEDLTQDPHPGVEFVSFFDADERINFESGRSWDGIVLKGVPEGGLKKWLSIALIEMIDSRYL